MYFEKHQLPVLAIMLLAIVFFTGKFIFSQNYEFIAYVGVVIFFSALVFLTHGKVNYPTPLLWGLTIWAVLHLAGGGLTFNGTRFYDLILIPIIGEPFLIFKYDQLVHMVGFFVATLVVFHILKPHLKKKFSWTAVGIVVVMAGLGLGALNEIVEFFASVAIPSSGVGGYINTGIDLVANLIGGLLAFAYIKWRN